MRTLAFILCSVSALADTSLPQLSSIKPIAPQPGRYAVTIDFRKEKYPTREIYERESLRATLLVNLLPNGSAELFSGYQRNRYGSVSHFASHDQQDHQSENQDSTNECHEGRWSRRGAWVDLQLRTCKETESAKWRLSCTSNEKNLLICESDRLNEAFTIPIDPQHRRAVLAKQPGLRVIWRDERDDRTPRIRLEPSQNPIAADDYKRP